MKENIPLKIKVNTVYRKEKPDYCGGPEYILIDDELENIQAWKRAGGTGILYRNINQVLEDIVRVQERYVSSIHVPRFSFEDFIVCDENILAYKATEYMTSSENDSMKLLYIYGETGAGKTYLLKTAAEEFQHKNPEKKVVYAMMEDFINSIRNESIPAFRKYYMDVDFLLIDDFQFISGRESIQEELQYILKFLENSRIIIAADRAPGQMKDIGEELRRILYSNMIAGIELAPDIRFLEEYVKKSGNAIDDRTAAIIKSINDKYEGRYALMASAYDRILKSEKLLGRKLSEEEAVRMIERE